MSYSLPVLSEKLFDVQEESEHFVSIAMYNKHITLDIHTQFIQEVQWDNEHSTFHVTQILHVSTHEHEEVISYGKQFHWGEPLPL